VRALGGHPMLAYTIASALESGVFESVIVSTDTEEVAAIARYYGAEVPFLRPPEYAGDTSPDIEWVEYTLRRLQENGRGWHCFSLLRPTSPFRTAHTIRRAWAMFSSQVGADSLRAVELCTQHPGKMWVVDGERMRPLLDGAPPGRPWHSTPYQALPPVYIQNASLEIAWTRVVFEQGTIAGEAIVPFLTEGYEGFDINDRHDWVIAEQLVAAGEASLPPVRMMPYEVQWVNSSSTR
jgi:CMP-N-acetylneuraminic acid synthetase